MTEFDYPGNGHSFGSDKKIVFVGGAPRSGTTLVHRVLGAHSKVYAGPEFDFVPKFAALRRRMAQSVRSGRISAIVDESGVDDALRGALVRIFNEKARRESATMFSEKTPANLLEFPTLLELFPGAYFVFVLRDPRAVAASMKEVGRRYRDAGKCPPGFCRSVMASAHAIDRFWSAGFAAMEAAPGRVLAVHYEDVVAQPEVEASRLTEFLGLEDEPEMIRIENQPLEIPAVGLGEWYKQEQLQAGIYTDSVNKHFDNLSAAELAILGRVVSDHPQALRYRLKRQPRNTTATIMLFGYRMRKAVGKRCRPALQWLMD